MVLPQLRGTFRFLVICGLLPLLSACGGGSTSSGSAAGKAGPTPVIILALDTFRGDHLGIAGMKGIATPHLDALAADGVYFANCLSTSPWTGPSFASIFTGLLPYHHGFLGGKHMRLAPEHVTLAEHLRDQGYVGGSFITIGWLSGAFGMAQGFGEGRKVPDGPPGRQADGVTADGLAFVDTHRDEPFLLFMHYFDAHSPYTPPAPFDRMYYRGDEKAPGRDLGAYFKSDQNLVLNLDNKAQMYDWLDGVTDLQFPIRQYAAGVSHVDDHVGQVVAGLEQRGLYERALIIVVADHGEHLGEHGLYFTHALPYREAIHVPLIVKWPGGRHAGRIVADPVSTVDILPTLLSILDLPAPATGDGHDLTPLLEDENALSLTNPVAEEGYTDARFSKSIVVGDWKLMAFGKDGKVYPELFHLGDDPDEVNNVAADNPEVVDRLLRLLSAFVDWKRPLTKQEPLPALTRGDATAEKLRSLGYVH